MPILDDQRLAPPQLRVVVEQSAAVELEWVLNTAHNRSWRDDHPTLGDVYAATPGIEEAIAGLWGPDEALSCGGFSELLLLAHHAGLLFSSDGAAVVDALEETAAGLSAEEARPPLLSETDDDRRVLQARLQVLRRSKARRARYAEVLAAAWEGAGPDWEANGRRLVDQAVAGRRRLLDRGAGWQEVADAAWFAEHHAGFFEHMATAVAALPPGGTVAVVPAYYTHNGLFTDLPGLLLVGVRADRSGLQARTRTEALAKSLKTVSDPTRLAILDALRGGGRTVGELAQSFALAQPTVSNHVKLLRDAGLVAEDRQGRRRLLVVRPEAVEDLLRGLQDVLAD